MQLIFVQAMLLVIFFISGFIGNVIMYGLARPMEIGGFTIMGSIVFMPLTLPLVARLTRLKISRRSFADIVALAFIPTQIVGKLACFAAGCCYGTVTDGPLWVQFPQGVVAPHSVHLHPAQLYEALGLTLLWVVCHRLYQKRHAAGVVMGAFLIGKGVERFLSEFVRGDVVMLGGGLTTGQLAAIACAIMGAVYILLRDRASLKTYDSMGLGVATGS